MIFERIVIDEFYDEMNAIKGVEALAIFNNDGKLIAQKVIENHNENIIEQLSESLLQIFGVLEGLRSDEHRFFQLSFNKRHVFAYSADEFITIVVGRSVTDSVLIRLMLEKGAYNLTQSKKHKRYISQLSKHKLKFLESSKLDEIEKNMLIHILGDS